MANVLKFKRGATELSLLAGEGAGLRSQKWYPKMADIIYGQIPPYVVEEMDVLADRTSHDDLATTIQALDDMRRWAAMFRPDRVISEPVWLHAKIDNETGERRICIRRISGEWRSSEIDTAGEILVSDAKLRLLIERHPFWERPAYVTATSGTGLSGASILHNYGTIYGDIAARVTMLDVRQQTGTLDRLWIGLRSSEYGTPSNFVNIWECEAASLKTDAALATDATASPGGGGNTKVVVNFATQPGWARRFEIRVNLVTANITDQIGRMLWLLRTKVDSSTTCEVQLRFGYTWLEEADFIQGPILQVSNTSWDYKEMGESVIPPVNLQSEVSLKTIANRTSYASIELWARRTSGSGSLHLDCMCPIPLNEGWLVVKGIKATGVEEEADRFIYMQSPHDETMAWAESSVGPVSRWTEYSDGHFRFPPGTGGRMVIVYADETQSVLTNQIKVYPYYYPRYLNLRGSD